MKWAADQVLDSQIEKLLDLSERLRRQCAALREDDAARRELYAAVFQLSGEAARRSKAALDRIDRANSGRKVDE